MTLANFTQAEAQARAALVSNAQYQIELDLVNHEATEFRSKTTIAFKATAGASTWIDLIAPSVNSIELNGEVVPNSAFNGFRVELSNLRAENKLVIDANCAYSTTGEGLHRFVDPVDNERYLYSQFETADARRAFACFDQPDIKARYSFTMKAPKHWVVLSNTATEPSDAGEFNLWQFPETEIMSTYITGIMAGNYHQTHDKYEGKFGAYPLRVLCRQSLKDHLNYKFMFETVKHGFAVFERDFNVGYPFGKYDQIFVPEFNSGAMENAGCVTFRDDYIWRGKVTAFEHHWLSNVVLHELAHMWFGNYVTMEWWNDLWLNESFAEWAAYHAQQEQPGFTDAWVNFLTTRKSWGYRQTQLPSTHPIATDVSDLESVWDNFDGISYAMGASVLRQLTVAVGIDKFLKGLQIYFSRHAWANAKFEDLLAAVGEAAGQDLTAWAEVWIRKAGVTTLRTTAELDGETYKSVTVEQEPPASPVGLEPVLRPHRFAIGHYDVTGNKLVRTKQEMIDIAGSSTEVKTLAGSKAPSVLLLNDDDFTFAKIRLDQNSWRNVIEHFGKLEDTLSRSLIWDAAWDLTRDAEGSAGDYVALALNGMASEPDSSTIAIAVRNLKTAVDLYAKPANQAKYRQQIASKLLEYVLAAPASSDHQLAFVRGLCAFASPGYGLEELINWYRGSNVPSGLQVDTDLRWTLLNRMVRQGVAAHDEIAAELEIDNSSKGHEESVRLKAAIPTASAKAAAWESIVAKSDASNAIVENTIAGFNDYENPALHNEYISKYFVMLSKLWQGDRGYHVAQNITIGLYPMPLVSDELVKATETYLAQSDIEPSAKRFVSEQLANLNRAIAARATD